MLASCWLASQELLLESLKLAFEVLELLGGLLGQAGALSCRLPVGGARRLSVAAASSFAIAFAAAAAFAFAPVFAVASASSAVARWASFASAFVERW